jgi:hypothetical protein
VWRCSPRTTSAKSFIAARAVAWWLSAWPVDEAFVVTTASAHPVERPKDLRRVAVRGWWPLLAPAPIDVGPASRR